VYHNQVWFQSRIFKLLSWRVLYFSYNALQSIGSRSTFRRNISLPPSGPKNKPRRDEPEVNSNIIHVYQTWTSWWHRCESLQTNSVALSDRHWSANFSANFCGQSFVSWSARRIPHGRWSEFSRPEPLLFFQVAPHLCLRGWVNPVPDPLLHRKFGSAGNRTQDLWISSQKLWPLDYRGGLWEPSIIDKISFATISLLWIFVYVILMWAEVWIWSLTVTVNNEVNRVIVVASCDIVTLNLLV
jgi:hypothetical protein